MVSILGFLAYVVDLYKLDELFPLSSFAASVTDNSSTAFVAPHDLGHQQYPQLTDGFSEVSELFVQQCKHYWHSTISIVQLVAAAARLLR